MHTILTALKTLSESLLSEVHNDLLTISENITDQTKFSVSKVIAQLSQQEFEVVSNSLPRQID